MINHLRRIIFGISILLAFYGKAQTIQVGSLTENDLRWQQVAGLLDSSVSFTSRSFIAPIDFSGKRKDSLSGKTDPFGNTVHFAGKLGKLTLLPVSLIQQFNTHHPYGWNNGGMIAANGYQAIASAGVYASFGPLEVQLQPEFVYAADAAYDTTDVYGSYRSNAYHKFFPGQSSIRFSMFSLSAGLSTENLWWGPGVHSSLLMSNNAPGFMHVFFRSQKPVRSGIGSFEWQLIAGKLTPDPALPYENKNLKRSEGLTSQRYLSAFVLSYQPKWVPGLFVGMTRALQRYRADMDKSGAGFLNKYIPVLFKAFDKQNASFDDTMGTDQLASFFMRWLLVKAQTEFYVEYGYNDYKQNLRDYLTSPTHAAAYIVGAKKTISLKADTYLDLGIEITQVSQSPDQIVRSSGNWYEHTQIQEGYTFQNQIMGAGAGYGANVQSVSGTWISGNKKLGVLLERVNRDPDRHAYKWIDLSIGFLPQWQFDHIILAGKFQFINSKQYAWEKDMNRFNFHSRISFQYQF